MVQGLESKLGGLFKFGVIAAPLMAMAGTFALTAGTDESWILLGVRGLVEHGRYGEGSPVVAANTTGGLHTVLAGLLHAAGGGSLIVIRLASVGALVALLALLHRLARLVLGDGRNAWLAAGAPLAVPGTFVLASQAYGAVLATVLTTAGLLLWAQLPAGSWRRRAFVGLILGTAMATRLNFLVVLPVPLIAALLRRERRRAELLDAALATACAALTFAAEWQLLSALTSTPLTATQHQSHEVAGMLDLHLAYLIPKALASWSVGESLMPLFVPVLVTAGWLWARGRTRAPGGPDALLVFAWLLLGAWLVQPMVPHLRYLWPAIAVFALVGALALIVLHHELADRDGRPALRLAVPVVGLAVLAGGYIGGVRSYLKSDSDVLSWEWSREARYSLQHGPLRPIRSQRAIVERLKSIPPEEPIATVAFDTALSYLTRRSIVPVSTYYPGQGGELVVFRPERAGLDKPRWLVVTPIVNAYPATHLAPRLHRWMEENCRLEAREGPYALYRVVGPYPATADLFALDLWETRLPLESRP